MKVPELTTGELSDAGADPIPGREWRLTEVCNYRCEYCRERQFEPPLQGEILRNYAEVSKAERMLVYLSNVKLSRGLMDTWEWLKQNRVSLYKDNKSEKD